MEEYNINEKNILRHELIGLYAEVVESTDKNKVGLNGKIIDETKNTFCLESNNKMIILPKKEVKLLITLPNNKKIVVEGKSINIRPEDRVKQVKK